MNLRRFSDRPGVPLLMAVLVSFVLVAAALMTVIGLIVANGPTSWLFIVGAVTIGLGFLVAAAVSFHLTRRLRQSQRAVEESEERYRLLLENARVGVVVIQDDGVRFANPTALAIMGQQRTAVPDLWSAAFFQSLVSEGGMETSDSLVEKLLSEPGPGSREVQIVPPDGAPRWLEMTGAPLDWQPQPAAMLVFSDVTERKKIELEREELITYLVDALGRFKTLRGLVPICASCKKIRDVQGAWHQVEEFVGQHSEAEFTHGICPECAARHHASPAAGSDDRG